MKINQEHFGAGNLLSPMFVRDLDEEGLCGLESALSALFVRF